MTTPPPHFIVDVQTLNLSEDGRACETASCFPGDPGVTVREAAACSHLLCSAVQCISWLLEVTIVIAHCVSETLQWSLLRMERVQRFVRVKFNLRTQSWCGSRAFWCSLALLAWKKPHRSVTVGFLMWVWNSPPWDLRGWSSHTSGNCVVADCQ